MIEKRQQAYLEAMNIPVWVARHQQEVMVELQQVAAQQVETSRVAAPQGTTTQGETPQDAPPQRAESTLLETAADTLVAASLETAAVARPGRAAAADNSSALKAVSQGLKLGPGSDGVLLVCARDSDSASKLANDIARVLPKSPVWGWPDSDDSAVAPFDAVNENLFTCVAIFGDALAQLLFDKQVPAALGSATVVILPAMSELESSSDARRKLWSELCRSGMIVA